MKKNLIAIVTGLFLFFWFAALTSQSLMDLADGLLFICGAGFLLAIAFRKKRWQLALPTTTGLGWLCIAWFAVVALGLFLNNPLNKDTVEAFLEFRWILIFHVLCFTLAWIEWDAKKINAILVILLVMVGASFVIYHIEPEPRAGGPFGHSMPFAHTYGPAVVFAAGILLIGLKNNTRWKRLAAITAVSGFVITALSMTRGAWLGIFAGVLCISCFRSRKYGSIISACLAAVFVLTLVFSPEARDRALTTNSSNNMSDNTRKSLWRGNFEIIKDFPIFGSGYSQNKNLLPKYYAELGISPDTLVSHAHNQYIHFWAGTGTIGLIFYLIFLFRVIQMTLLAWLRLPQERAELKALALGVLGGQICFVIGSLTESNFSIAKNRYMFLLLSALGASLYYRYIAKQNFESYKELNTLE